MKTSPGNELTAAERTTIAATLRAAVALRNAGRNSDAIAVLRGGAAAAPRNATLQCELGLALAGVGQEAEAIPYFERALALDHRLQAAWLALSIALQSVGHEGNAIRVLEKATASIPKNAELHLRLGDLLHRWLNPAEARESYRRGAAVGRNTTIKSICEAKALACDERFTEAAEILKCALARDPNNGAATHLRGEFLTYLGALDDAAKEYERALTLSPDQPWAAWHGLTRSRKIAESDRPLLGRIEAMLPKARLPLPLLMQAEFALGKACDDLGDYDRAMLHFDAANQIRRRRRPFNRTRFIEAIELATTCFTPRYLADRAGFGSTDETPTLVVGMPRSGTTLVEQLLSNHPRIAGGGELGFWSSQTGAMDRSAIQALDRQKTCAIAVDYLAKLRRHGASAWRIIDKNPLNFHWLGLIRLIFPNCTFIHCRRNAIDTCLSNYVTDFQTSWGFNSNRDDLVFAYRHYRHLMAYWRETLDLDRVVEVDYEQLTTDTDGIMRSLVAGVGLNWDEACLHPDRNPRSVRTASVWQVRQPVYRTSAARWRNYEPWLGSLRELEDL